MMNSLERYMAMLNGRTMDIVPRIPILMQFAAEYIGSNYGAFASDFNVLVDSNIRCAQDFGMDQLSAISDPYRETQGFGAKIIYSPNSVPKCESYPLEKSKDISLLSRPDPHSSGRMLDRVRAIELYKEKFGGEYSIMGWIEGPVAEAADLRGVGNFLIDLIDDPDYASELMDLCTEVGIEFALAQVEGGADTIGVGDAIASQVSPDIYEKFILPREKKIVSAIKEAGAFVRLHICGDITHLLKGIAGLEIDIIDVDHMVDMKKVRQTLGTPVVLAGNIDPVSGVKRADPDSIRDRLTAIYDDVGNPFMVNAGCEIPPGTPFENLKSLCAPIKYRP
jgi:MtaA/CmuA family methyltransferase